MRYGLAPTEQPSLYETGTPMLNPDETNEQKHKPLLTCLQGSNSDLFPLALRLYVPPGSRIADVTYGHGVFWRKVDTELYEVVASDLSEGVDFRHLPYV